MGVCDCSDANSDCGVNLRRSRESTRRGAQIDLLPTKSARNPVRALVNFHYAYYHWALSVGRYKPASDDLDPMDPAAYSDIAKYLPPFPGLRMKGLRMKL